MAGDDESPESPIEPVPRESPIPKGEATSHDTEADAQRARRLKARAEPDVASEAEPAVEADAETPLAERRAGAKGNLPQRRARLSAVKVHEATVRKRFEQVNARRDPRALHPSQKAVAAVELSFVRARDRSLRAYRVGLDGVRIIGVAEGVDHQGEPSDLAVGSMEGESFSVTLAAGARAAEAAELFATRLASAYELELDHESEGSSFIRLVRSRSAG